MSAEYLQSELLWRAGFRHAFFTRRGGVSDGPFASLNFSSAVGDRPERVAKNLELAANALGIDRARLFFLSQVHGSEVVVVDGSEDREVVLHQRGDGVASRTPGVACGVRAADCVPVLLAERSSGAVAALHAGWRGTVAGIVTAGLDALRALAGSESDFLAAIGPHISVGAFEVSEEVAAELARACPDPAADVIARDKGPRPHVSLAKILRAQLVHGGLADDAIDEVGGCTLGEPERFFSFRRDGRTSGRHLAAIVAR
jgi:YfiH family protein